MVTLLRIKSRGEKIAHAVYTAREAVDTLSVGQRNMLLTLQCSLKVITKETPLSTLFPDDILHAQHNSLFEALRKISDAL